MQLDYANILRAGQGLVPNLREQMMQDEQSAQNRQIFDMKRQQFELQQAQAIKQQQREQAFMEARDRALLTGRPQDIQRLRMEFPEFTKDMKDAFDAMDSDRQRVDLTQLGAAYTRAEAGDLAGAAAILEARVKADREAGEPDEIGEAILEALRSDDPVQQRAAKGQIGIMLATVAPDKFTETYGKLNPVEAKTTTEREYEFRLRKDGKEAADQWLAGQDVRPIAVEPGGQIYDARDFARPTAASPSAAQGGGDPSTGARVPATGAAIEQAATAAVPGIRVTSRKRTPEQNRRAGGAARSYHLTDQARDFTPPPGMSMSQLATQLKQTLPGFKVINEGDHVHVEPTRGASGPARVRSKQEYDRLPSGTPYIAPDGSQRVKS
jgi:hypothetical protein